MNNLKNILLKILEAIDYTDDKESFVSEFEKNIRIESFLDLTESLPDEKQIELNKNLTEVKDNPEKIAEILRGYFSEEKIQDSIVNTTKNAFSEYIQTIVPVLAPTQSENLKKVLEELGQSA